MAFRASAVTIGTVATLLIDAQAGDLEAWVNVDPNADHYLGGPSVTDLTGLHLFGRTPFFSTKIRPGDKLYAVVSSGTVDADVLVRSA